MRRRAGLLTDLSAAGRTLSFSAALRRLIEFRIFLRCRRCSTPRLLFRSSSFRSYRKAPSTAAAINASWYCVKVSVCSGGGGRAREGAGASVFVCGESGGCSHQRNPRAMLTLVSMRTYTGLEQISHCSNALAEFNWYPRPLISPPPWVVLGSKDTRKTGSCFHPRGRLGTAHEKPLVSFHALVSLTQCVRLLE